MRLLFACPTYGPSADPSFDKSRRAAIMFAANNGVKWIGDVSPDRMGWAAARNAIVEAALSADDTERVDGVFWVDDDLVIPVETIAKLASYDLDFVGGLYFQRGEPYWPLFAFLNKKGSFQWPAKYPENVLSPCDGIGFGCVYTSINLLRKVSELPQCKKDGPFGGDFGKRTYGEDFTFCRRARLVGIRPHVDTAIKCEHHIGPKFANEDTFRRFGGLLGGSNGSIGCPEPEDICNNHQEGIPGSGELHPRTV